MAKEKILICDDEEGVRESLKLILSEKYSLSFARTGDEAVSAISKAPDLKAVLLDIKMPGKNGIEALKKIKSINKGIPVIIISGYQSVEAVREASREGAADYIIKPFDSESVIDSLKKALG